MVDKALLMTNDKEKAAELILGMIDDQPDSNNNQLNFDEAFKESLKGLAGMDPNM